MADFSSYLPQGQGASPDAIHVFRQSGGCGIRIYPNGISDGRPEKMDLFQEIRSADTDRTTTDIAGSFSFFLLPNKPWDELIRPDDFLRIFMGDKLVSSSPDNNAYNFASQKLDQKSAVLSFSNPAIPSSTGIELTLPGSLTQDGLSSKTALLAKAIMSERMIGKVDRISKVKSGPGPSQGTVTGYIVSGRSMGSILQDISLYYNEFLAPLNAVNIFLESNAAIASGSPDQFVQEAISVILTSVPFPQWTLPDALAKDLNYAAPGQLSLRQKNMAIVQPKIAGFQAKLAAFKLTPQKAQYKGDVIGKLQSLVSQAGTIAENSPFSAISIAGILPCFGTNFNRSFLSSVTTGVYDLVKHLSNPEFNEFWFDLCPGGDPLGGAATEDALVPTFTLRQRPYDITDDMLKGVSSFIKKDAEKGLASFPQEKLQGISSSLADPLMLNCSFSVFGPLASAKIDLNGAIASFEKYGDADTEAGFAPMLMPGGYDVGYSGHDRLNSFLCLGAYNSGQGAGSSRIIAAECGGFNIDVESIKKYGIRVMEVSTQFAQPNASSFQEKDVGQTMATFSRLISNWNYMNHCLLNGRLTCRFLNKARLGVPVKYWETRVTPDNPYPKMELFYVQGVSDHFENGQPLTTSLTVTRGIRYNIVSEQDVSSSVANLIAALGG